MEEKIPSDVVVVREKKITRNYTWLAGLVALVLIAVILVFVKKSSERLETKTAELDKQIVALNNQLEEQQVRREELEKRSIFITTKQFIEEFAREKLGLVYDDEIIFRPKDE